MVDTSGWEHLGEDPWPEQGPISLDDIQGLIDLEPRRVRLADRGSIFTNPSETNRDDWGFWLPFRETLWNVLASCGVALSGPNPSTTGSGCGGFLPGLESGEPGFERLKKRVEDAYPYIAIRDHLAMSFALDFTREKGPDTPYTSLYETLRATEPTAGTTVDVRMRHADRLADEMVAFVRELDCYETAQIVTAVPPKDPATVFHLPFWLADQLAGRLNIERGATKVKTTRLRQSMRNTGASDRLELLKGTIEVVEPDAFLNKIVLIVDDVYQSGTSMNYLAYLLQQAGARAMFGLSCVKTLTNTDAVE